MTTGDKVAKLIDALDEGFILYKDHHDEDGETREFLFKERGYYESKGWASALGDVKDRILEITQNPDVWKIYPNFNMKTDDYPYPWSTKFQK